MSAFFCKKSAFLAEIKPLLKAIMWQLCCRFFSSVYNFCKIKGYYQWKHKFYRLWVWKPASRLLQIGCKLEKCQWRHNFLTLHNRHIFNDFLFLLSSLVTSPSFMSIASLVLELTIFFYKGLNRNLEIGNTYVWALSNIWRLG